MIIWGGVSGANSLYDGASYNVAANTWSTVTPTGAPAGRYDHKAVWTGGEMILFGGYNNVSAFQDTWSYTPGKTMILYQRP